MKIRKNVDLDILESFGYHYEPYLLFPTYQKKIIYGNYVITVDVLIKDRTVFINKSSYITKRNIHYINDLISEHLIEE